MPTTSARGTRHEADASAEAATAAGVEDGGLGVSVEGGREGGREGLAGSVEGKGSESISAGQI